MKHRGHPGGFSLIEVIISSIILSSMMMGMIAILSTYSKSASRGQDIGFAANLAQQELDIILADLKIQQSLASRDTAGRSMRCYIYLNDGTFRGFINNFFFTNFAEINHDRPDLPPWTEETNGPNANYFKIEAGNRFYDENGEYLGHTTNTDEDADPFSAAKYVSRIQIYGMPASANDTDIESVENEVIGTTYRYLMADTDTGISNTTVDNTYPMRKLLVVKVYHYFDYLKNGAHLVYGPGNPGIEKKSLCELKLIINGGA
jgi:type II secretory pathway pseudopilin PulG